MTTAYQPDGHTMLDRPGDLDYFHSLVASTPPPDPPGFTPSYDPRAGTVGVPPDGPPDPRPLDEQRATYLGTEVAAGVYLRAMGPSWYVTVEPFGASFLFRDVRTDRDLSADVTVAHRARHVFRSTCTLSLAGREKVAKVAAQLTGADHASWVTATFRAVEAVMGAVEALTAGSDLRVAQLAGARGSWVVRPFLATGAALLVMPGEGGKSTIARALSVSVATGREVIPGMAPVVAGPVLYVAAEDAAEHGHARSIEAICRGAGIERSAIEWPVTLIASRGRPLERMVRSLAERASDAALVVLDAQQGLLAAGDRAGGIRDQSAAFWNAVDELGTSVLVIAHPNRSEARDWDRADGRAAGSEVNRDRPRIAWRGQLEDEPAAYGTSYRRYVMTCGKYNHGPRPDPLGFAAQWQWGTSDDDPGAVWFHAADVLSFHGDPTDDDRRPTKAEQETMEAYEAGATTPAALAKALDIGTATAKKRIQRLRERRLLPSEGASE